MAATTRARATAKAEKNSPRTKKAKTKSNATTQKKPAKKSKPPSRDKTVTKHPTERFKVAKTPAKKVKNRMTDAEAVALLDSFVKTPKEDTTARNNARLPREHKQTLREPVNVPANSSERSSLGQRLTLNRADTLAALQKTFGNTRPEAQSRVLNRADTAAAL